MTQKSGISKKTLMGLICAVGALLVCLVTALVSALAAENCTVNSIKEQDESLESFYMNLVGGERNA